MVTLAFDNGLCQYGLPEFRDGHQLWRHVESKVEEMFDRCGGLMYHELDGPAGNVDPKWNWNTKRFFSTTGSFWHASLDALSR
jgi:hypothetical protein